MRIAQKNWRWGIFVPIYLWQLLVQSGLVSGAKHRIKRTSRHQPSESEVLQTAIRVHDAIQMQGAHGSPVEDDRAHSGFARYCDSSMPCPIHLIYGPYESLPAAGLYEAIFKIKASTVTDRRELLRLDVISNGNRVLNSYRTVRGTDFIRRTEYQFFRVEFDYRDEDDIEYRVIQLEPEGEVAIDYVAVAPIRERASEAHR